MYLRGQCCFTSFRLQGFHTSHLFFFLRGGGRNGKSWLMKTILDVTACGHQPGDSACAREATAFSRIDAPWHWDGAVSGRIGATGIMLSQLDSAGLNIECWTESYRRGAKWSSFFLELPRLDTRNVINPLHEAKLADICPQISSIVPVATWTTRFKWVSSWFGHGSASPVLPSTQVLPKKCRPVQMNRKKWWSRNHRLVKHLRRPKMSLKRQLCLCLLCLLYLLYHWQTWDREKGPALETRKVIRVLQWLRWRWAVANVDVRMLQPLIWFELFIVHSLRFVILCVSCFVSPTSIEPKIYQLNPFHSYDGNSKSPPHGGWSF